MSDHAGSGGARRERAAAELACRALAAEAMNAWRRGERPDARAVLEEHPELRRHKTLVLDLAYEEYCLRGVGGESVEAVEFCERFPTFQKSLERRLQIHRLLEEESSFRRELGDVQWPGPGEEMLGFEMIEELGRGTFGRVYLAREKALGERLVAVKLCLGGADEADTLGKLEHPNIVPVHSVRRDTTGLTVICMPYKGRATLCDVLDAVGGPARRPERAGAILRAARRINADEPISGCAGSVAGPLRGSFTTGVVWIAWRLADALAHAHSRGVVHLDLKPSNVLIDSSAAPLLLDFNLSSDRKRAGRRFGGTLPYMSPEQIRAVVLEEGNEGSIDGRSDIFSLGVMLYELTYGQLPFGAALRARTTVEAANELLKRQQEGAHFPPDRRVGRGISRVIGRCLALDPGKRFPSARELASALGRELSASRRLGRWTSRRRALVATAGVLASAGLIGAVVFLALRPPYSVREYEQGVADYERKDYSAAIEHFNRSLASDPSSAPTRFLRARTYTQLGDFVSAIRDLKTVVNDTSDPRAMAFLGYCLNNDKYHIDAIGYYSRAIEAGYRPVTVYNNLGYSYIQLGQIRKGRDVMLKALEIDPGLPAVLHNFARAEFVLAQQEQRPPTEALQRMSDALAGGKRSAQLYRDAALLAALVSESYPERDAECVTYLARAINHGETVESLLANPCFVRFFQENPELKRQLPDLLDDATCSATALLNPLNSASPLLRSRP